LGNNDFIFEKTVSILIYHSFSILSMFFFETSGTGDLSGESIQRGQVGCPNGRQLTCP